MSIVKKVRTPCIGVCSTGIGDAVCRGCKRFSHEIIEWNSYSEAQKHSILQRMHVLLSQVVKARVVVLDEDLLRAQCQTQRVRIREDASAYCWVFDLLKAGASQIQNLEHYGCRLQPEYAAYSLLEVRDDIDKDFFILSQVHYERYFEALFSEEES